MQLLHTGVLACGSVYWWLLAVLLILGNKVPGAQANRNAGQDDEYLSTESVHVHVAKKSRPALMARHFHRGNVTLKMQARNRRSGLDPFMLLHVSGDYAEGEFPQAEKQYVERALKNENVRAYPGASPYMQLISARANQQEFSRTYLGMFRDMLLNLGGGTGATVGGTGDVSLDQDLLRRMRFQDKAVMLLLLVAYTGSLAFSASLVYRQAANNSPILYYADPRFHNIAVDDDDLEGFLEAFNQSPKDTHLQVTGLLPLANLPESFMDHGVEWMGSRYRVAFSFALDLSPWVIRCEVPPQDSQSQRAFVQTEAADGVDTEDLRRLADFLAYNNNDLAVLEIDKEITWKNWEELAMNIKHHIRQCGFRGVTTVTRSSSEVVMVHKNRPWSNFMHSRTTKVLCALSIFGWLVYQPYMALRNSSTKIRSRFRIDVDIRSYWALISDKINSEGFDANGAPMSH